MCVMTSRGATGLEFLFGNEGGAAFFAFFGVVFPGFRAFGFVTFGSVYVEDFAGWTFHRETSFF
jgi:hypothetical protein